MSEKPELSAVEYTVFLSTLAFSALIGVYYGFVKTTGQNTVSGYLFGGKRMPVIPISLSMISSYISGITMIGLPSEVYYFSTQYLVVFIPMIVAGFVQIYVALPVFYKLQLVSAFEYMELRFGRGVRTVTSLLYCISSITHSAVVIYGPALALNQVTGIDVQTISIAVSIVCVFYTTFGGVKAVVWADTFQTIVMLFSVLAVLIIGVQQSGGNGAVIRTSLEGGRIEFFNLNPSARISFWSQSVGMQAMFLASIAFNPTMIQRLICVASMEKAILSCVLFIIGIIFFFFTCGYLGLAMYGYYKDCDPFAAKFISEPDQIVPYFVMDVSSDFKGLCGLFLAGVASAAFSSLSTSINTLAGTAYEDFIEPLFKVKPKDGKASAMIKILAVTIGGVCVILTSLVSRLGYMLELATGFGGLTSGAILGLFLLGVFHPRATNEGAVIGGIASLLVMGTLMTQNFVHKYRGSIKTVQSVLNVDGCPFNVTLPPPVSNEIPDDDVFPLFKIPVFYYSGIGTLIVLTVGSLVSLVTESDDLHRVNRDCLSPWVHRFAKSPVNGKTSEIADLTLRNSLLKEKTIEND